MSSSPENTLQLRRTKIIATLGPATSDEGVILQLVEAGVNVFRLNMSHGSHDEHRTRYARVRTAAAQAKTEIAVLADLSGPKIRVGTFEGGQIELVNGSRVTVTTRQVQGQAGLIVSQYLALSTDVVVGDRLLLDDGNLELRVLGIAGTEIDCEVVHGGILKDKKGMNLPGVRVSAPALTDKDRADALFARDLGVDFLALSFVRSPDDLVELRRLMLSPDGAPLLIAKIEKPEALDVIESILDVSDGIMVARGDLGVELDATRVPNVQEELVDLARAAHKPVIIATQMLESMITHARPTRAEVTDVANAVRSGADAVMLSAETAAGANPVAAVRTMDLVIRSTEEYLFSHGAFSSIERYTPTVPDASLEGSKRDPDLAIASAAAQMSRELRTSAIVADARALRLLSILCSKRPAAFVYAVGGDARACSLGCLLWGARCIATATGTEQAAITDRAVGLRGSEELEQSGGFVLVVASLDGRGPSLSILG